MEKTPLAGLHIMVTRPADARDLLAEQLRSLGADVIAQPVIRIGPPADWQPVDAALARWDQFDWLVFSSANGVRFLLDRLRQRELFSLLQSIKLAAIGPGTAEALAQYGLSADCVPEQFRAEALAESLLDKASGRRFLLARASRGRDVLAERLTVAGAAVEQIVVYTSTDVEQAEPAVVRRLQANEIDWVTVTSSAIARSLARLFGNDLRRTRLASISPLTSDVLRELGYPPAAEADPYTMPGLVAAIQHLHNKERPS
jgi:uroporphyrinogen III methyltransferase/synthase